MNLFSRVLGACLPILALAIFSVESVCAGGKAECSACHADTLKNTFVHSPVAAADCLSCHQRPVETHPGVAGQVQLIRKGDKLCYGCHDNKAGKKYVHTPVAGGDCVACHDPHHSENRYQLKFPLQKLCLQCHPEMTGQKFAHPPVVDGNCLLCHDPHQSDNRMQLKKHVVSLCESCHNKKLFSGNTEHQPVAAGECSACHNPHGSGYPHILKHNSSPDLYSSYQSDNFALCFTCHNNDVALDTRTETATGFRNGHRNLHTLHINRPIKGRTCKTCHDSHASRQDRLIRDKVTGFGRWEIPIRYTKTSTGGTCVVGCHKPQTYDRFNRDEVK